MFKIYILVKGSKTGNLHLTSRDGGDASKKSQNSVFGYLDLFQIFKQYFHHSHFFFNILGNLYNDLIMIFYIRGVSAL